jgi:hypothetical protein
MRADPDGGEQEVDHVGDRDAGDDDQREAGAAVRRLPGRGADDQAPDQDARIHPQVPDQRQPAAAQPDAVADHGVEDP